MVGSIEHAPALVSKQERNMISRAQLEPHMGFQHFVLCVEDGKVEH